MIMTGIAVITAPVWLPIYAVGVVATLSVYTVGALALTGIIIGAQ